MKEKKVNEVEKDIVTNNNDLLFHFSATIMTSCSKTMERCIRLDQEPIMLELLSHLKYNNFTPRARSVFLRRPRCSGIIL